MAQPTNLRFNSYASIGTTASIFGVPVGTTNTIDPFGGSDTEAGGEPVPLENITVFSKTPDINIISVRTVLDENPSLTDSLFMEFGTDGSYFVMAACYLETSVTQTIKIQFLINGTVVFETQGVHTETSVAPKEQSAMTILNIKAGDRLQVHAVGSSADPSTGGGIDGGSQLTVLRLRNRFASIHMINGQSSGAGTNIENVIGDVDLGGLSVSDISTNLSPGSIYESDTGYLTLSPRQEVDTGTTVFMMQSALVSVNSTSGNNIQRFKQRSNPGGSESNITSSGRECGRTEIGSADDPMEKTWSIIQDEIVNNTDVSFAGLVKPGVNRNLTFGKGTSFCLFDIGFDEGETEAVPEVAQFQWSFAGLTATDMTVGSGETKTIFKTDDGGSPGGQSEGITYNAATGKFTVDASTIRDPAVEGSTRPPDGYPSDYFISFHMTMPISSNSREGIKTVNVIKNGTEVIHKVQYYADNIIDDGFDPTICIIVSLKLSDTIEFQFVNSSFASGTNLIRYAIANIFRVGNSTIKPSDRQRVHFLGAQNMFPEAGITNTSVGFSGLILENTPPVPPLVETDNTINTHEKQNQRYRVVEQAPFRLGVNGPLSLRGRIGGVKPFNVGAGKRGGKK